MRLRRIIFEQKLLLLLDIDILVTLLAAFLASS